MTDHDAAAGPIDYVLLEFPDQGPTGELAAELMRLVDTGIIHIYDIIAIRVDAEGNAAGVAIDDLGDFAMFTGARTGLLGDDDIAEAAAALQPGTISVLLVYENTWAAPFVGIARHAGGELVAGARIPAQDVIDALDALDAAS